MKKFKQFINEESGYVPSTVKSKNKKIGNTLVHDFHHTEAENVHNHLKTMGFKKQYNSEHYGGVTTHYLKHDDGREATLQVRRRGAALDIKESIEESQLHLVRIYNKDGKRYHLWNNGNYQYNLTTNVNGVPKNVNRWHDNSLDDVHSKLSTQGFKNITEECKLEEDAEIGLDEISNSLALDVHKKRVDNWEKDKTPENQKKMVKAFSHFRKRDDAYVKKIVGNKTQDELSAELVAQDDDNRKKGYSNE